MPNFDGTGPRGQGPMTGRGMGKCKKSQDDQKVVDRPRQGRGLRLGAGRRSADGRGQQ